MSCRLYWVWLYTSSWKLILGSFLYMYQIMHLKHFIITVSYVGRWLYVITLGAINENWDFFFPSFWSDLFKGKFIAVLWLTSIWLFVVHHYLNCYSMILTECVGKKLGILVTKELFLACQIQISSWSVGYQTLPPLTHFLQEGTHSDNVKNCPPEIVKSSINLLLLVQICASFSFAFCCLSDWYTYA